MSAITAYVPAARETTVSTTSTTTTTTTTNTTTTTTTSSSSSSSSTATTAAKRPQITPIDLLRMARKTGYVNPYEYVIVMKGMPPAVPAPQAGDGDLYDDAGYFQQVDEYNHFKKYWSALGEKDFEVLLAEAVTAHNASLPWDGKVYYRQGGEDIGNHQEWYNEARDILSNVWRMYPENGGQYWDDVADRWVVVGEDDYDGDEEGYSFEDEEEEEEWEEYVVKPYCTLLERQHEDDASQSFWDSYGRTEAEAEGIMVRRRRLEQWVLDRRPFNEFQDPTPCPCPFCRRKRSIAAQEDAWRFTELDNDLLVSWEQPRVNLSSLVSQGFPLHSSGTTALDSLNSAEMDEFLVLAEYLLWQDQGDDDEWETEGEQEEEEEEEEEEEAIAEIRRITQRLRSKPEFCLRTEFVYAAVGLYALEFLHASL
ncbi:hypothetical protein DFH27DRAFT_250813 [Peziza echinospora]|nr:hypothetical protein DFH27DRAFT_250813 [Peziza echinospora]